MVYVTEHLLSIQLQQKKELHTKFKEAGDKTYWTIEEGNYCLYINNIKHTAED